ncbi:YebO family protein [Pantoea sp. KPR_PJ]|uniref:YebO family protein n=1 Tax=Pantoea sp. KPR_PJ TaxID=2738375 RepID=UPI003526C6DA
MNELAASSAPLFNYGVLAIIIVMALIAWFFVNRASVRASEQIALLNQLLDEQKKQNTLLRKLVESQSSAQDQQSPEEKRDFIRLIPER